MFRFSKFASSAISIALLMVLSSCGNLHHTSANASQSVVPETSSSSTHSSISQIEDNGSSDYLEQFPNKSGTIVADDDSLQEQATDSSDFETIENKDGTVTIKQYIGSGDDVIIPAEIDGKPVSAVGNIFGTTGAFQDCTTITSVEIPEGVTEIQDNAFYGCTSLETVTIPSSVVLLRNCAFSNCPNLRAIYFEGDAPQQANYVFDATENVIIYYQDGTSGWDNPWYGRPAEVYKP